MKVLAIFVACVALASAGLVRRDTPNALQDLQKHAEEFSKTFTEQFNSLVGSKNSQDFQKALKDGSDSVVQQISSLSASLQTVLTDANGKAKEALESARANLEKAAQDLRTAHPEFEQQAGELRERLQTAVTNTVQETQKLAKEVSANLEQTNQKLAPQLKAAYDDFVKNVQEVQKKVHEVATKQ